MTQKDFFGEAKWIGAEGATADKFSVLRGKFFASSPKKVTVNILGLGFFKCYINGECINPDTFLPLSSEYADGSDPAATHFPEGQKLSGTRIYVPGFDITKYVRHGENTIAVAYGGGWYTCPWRVLGLPKAIWRIAVEGDGKTEYFISDESCRVGESFVERYEFFTGEHHNYAEWQSSLGADFDDSEWKTAVLFDTLETEYCQTDCPTDALIKEIPVRRVGLGGRGVVYDVGENTVGYPVISVTGERGEVVEVIFSEELLPSGRIDPSHSHKQSFTVVCDGTPREVQPEFTWYGFRCFEIVGKGEPKLVKVVHSDVEISSRFECSNETINWIYKTFLHTILCNMHTGHPSDCPHIERRGYTGDGQLTCHAALLALDARALYEKWVQDIADGQDALTGHVQYTAPYIRSGGGPGGWGCAIVEIPYQVYRHFGDKSILSKYYKNMKRYIDYLEAHSEFGLVTSDEAGYWCLGDWCGPNILYSELDITYHNQQVFIPAAMVNTYFMVKALRKMARIADIIGETDDIADYELRASLRASAIKAAYFNAFDGNFLMNVQGANAFAVDIGVGSDKTYLNMRNYYEKLGHYDTGIFATDILTRLLFERGDGPLAVKLLSQNGSCGFERWRQSGATTFHEYWDSDRSRSHNHPMFGAVTACFFEYLLGIRQKEGSAGYKDIIIEPLAVSEFSYMKGSLRVGGGDIFVSYRKEAAEIRFEISIPRGSAASFKFRGEEYPLRAGENSFVFPCGEN